MEKNVVILDIDYVTYENKPVIRLFSKDKDKNIVLLDDTFEPYLYVAPKDDDKECQKQILDTLDDVHIEEVIKKDFQVEKTSIVTDERLVEVFLFITIHIRNELTMPRKVEINDISGMNG